MQPPKREPLGKKHDRVAFSCEDDALDTYLKKRASREATEVVSYAVVVDAIDDRARSFYEHYEFCAFPDRKLRLFLPMRICFPDFDEPYMPRMVDDGVSP